jgi:Stage II sporulation protein E (SpoIIE)
VTSIRRPVDTAELLEREIELAREIQLAALPASMPAVAGYDGAGLFRPAGPTGGDLFDFVRLPDARLLLLLGDATGHGLGPALSATQVTAMVRVALRLGATLDQTFRHVNDQLVEDLPADRFVTAFLGLLDPRTHAVHYHSAGCGIAPSGKVLGPCQATSLAAARSARGPCCITAPPPTTWPGTVRAPSRSGRCRSRPRSRRRHSSWLRATCWR